MTKAYVADDGFVASGVTNNPRTIDFRIFDCGNHVCKIEGLRIRDGRAYLATVVPGISAISNGMDYHDYQQMRNECMERACRQLGANTSVMPYITDVWSSRCNKYTCATIANRMGWEPDNPSTVDRVEKLAADLKVLYDKYVEEYVEEGNFSVASSKVNTDHRWFNNVEVHF